MRENFTSFEQEIMRELSLAANKKIMPYDFIAKHMKAIAIELLKDDKFVIVTSKCLPKDLLEYSLAEKSILDLMYILSYLEKEDLIVPQHYTKQELKVEDKEIRIFDKDKYIFHEKTGKGANAILTEEEYPEALKAGRYSHPTTINNQHAEDFYAESKLKSGVYIFNFIKKHSGCFLYVSPVLVELVDNDFKTHDQIRFEKTTKWAKLGLWLAFGLGLIGIVFNIYSIRKPTSFKESKQIEQEISSVKTETPKLINQQIKNDTLKVNMIKK